MSESLGERLRATLKERFYAALTGLCGLVALAATIAAGHWGLAIVAAVGTTIAGWVLFNDFRDR